MKGSAPAPHLSPAAACAARADQVLKDRLCISDLPKGPSNSPATHLAEDAHDAWRMRCGLDRPYGGY